MDRKFRLLMVLAIVLVATLSVVSNVYSVESSGTIYIRKTGEIEGTDKIERLNNTYFFVDNINDCINVERDDIIVDGRGFSLAGELSTYFAGLYLSGRHNVTIRNLTIKRFRYGVIVSSSSNISIISNNITVGRTIGYQTGTYLLNSSNNTVQKNRFSNNTRGIFLASSSENNISENEIRDNYNGVWFENSQNNTLSENNITNNEYDGIFIFDSLNNRIYGNNVTYNYEGIHLVHSSDNEFYLNHFVNNTHQVSIPTLGYVNLWDNGMKGNYWSDYLERYPNATELDGSEVWDTPYVIDEKNQDNYPIIPEFPCFLILPLLMVATVVVTLACRRKLALKT